MSAPKRAEALAAGVTPEDDFGYAEWLVQVDEHFGDCEQFTVDELEEFYDAAQSWWRGDRERMDS